MKSRIFLLIIVLLSTLQISFANNKIDYLFKKTKELPNAEYYTEDFKKPQVKGVVDVVKAIEVVEADIDNATYLALKKEIEEERKDDSEFREAWDESRAEYELIEKMIMLRKEKNITQKELAKLFRKTGGIDL